MRGNHATGGTSTARRGSIPAHAGEPRHLDRLGPRARVYPRMRGDRPQTPVSAGSANGLSPRMRGNPRPLGDPGGSAESIPAHAGEPRPRRLCGAPRRVYPRACGGTAGVSETNADSAGLSPRMRGNRPAGPRRAERRGSIPAHAG